MASQYEYPYHVGILDDLHNFFPALLYDQNQFQSLSDVFNYVNYQMNQHFNTPERLRREYLQNTSLEQPWRRSASNLRRYPTNTTTTRSRTNNTGNRVEVNTTETIDITPLFTTYLPQTTRTATAPIDPLGSDPLTDQLMNLIFPRLRGGTMEPVVVRPTIEQIERATRLRAATTQDEGNNCAICQDHYTDGQALRSIVHCNHTFHKNCIDTWFDRNVHCPVCRFDIRDQPV